MYHSEFDRILTYTLQAEDAGKSVAAYLRSRGFSRHLLIRLKSDPEGIMLSETPVKPSFRFPCNVQNLQLTVCIREEASSEHIPPVPLPLHIVYEDEDLLVLDKPPGMPIHPSVGNYENTLANALAYYYEKQGRPFIFRCINRLDRDTSGLLLVAKNAYSSVVLSSQMKERLIHREYLAVVMGCPQESGTIDAPIGRKPDSVLERQVNPENGAPAVTHYTRMALSPDGAYALLRIHLDTGRTHQIRVHMGYIGHPLPGDFLYCPDYTHFGRQPLHSHRLCFSHPVTGAAMTFTSPLPTDCHPEWFLL